MGRKSSVYGKLINDNGEEQKILNNDPYANYKQVKWAEITAESRTGAEITISRDKKVSVTYDGIEKQVTGISGTPAKVISTIGGGIPFFYILTEEGRVYNLEEWDSEAILIADLSKYKVIDMTPHINGNDRYDAMCFLTEDANIIDSQGKSYN